MSEKTYEFVILVVGTGDTLEEAWEDAQSGLQEPVYQLATDLEGDEPTLYQRLKMVDPNFEWRPNE